MTIALALGGGAGLGWAHIGVLRGLDALGIGIDAAAGTSIGAVAAVCAAADRLDALEDLARSATRLRVLRYLDPQWRPGAVLGGRGIERELATHFGDARLEELRHPCATVAADLLTGTEVVFATGPVVRAVRASVAIPGLLAPVVDGERLLVDGGLVNPVPVSVARTLSARPVVAVNLMSDYARRAAALGPKLSAIRVTGVALGLLLDRLARQALTLVPPDLELILPVGHIDAGDFTRAAELIAVGRRAVDDNAAALLRLAQRTGAALPV